MSKLELLLEGERRGLLNDDLKALLQEARSRGIVPAAQPARELLTPSETAADIAKSAGIGVAQGALGIATLPGNIEALGRAGINYGASLMGSEPVVNPDTTLPNFNDAKRFVEGFTGEFYQPQTTAGEYARTIGEFAPGALGGGSIAARAARVALPAVASESAGQLTEGTAFEPAARVAGALAGGMIPNVAARTITPLPANPQNARNVAELDRQGVTSLTAGQRTGSSRMRWIEDATQMAPGGGGIATRMQEQAAEQFTAAAMRRAGFAPPGGGPIRATPDIIEDAFTMLGQQYQNLAPRIQIQASPAFTRRLQRIVQDYERVTPEGMRIPLVRSVVDDIAARGAVAGDDFVQIRSQLRRAARGMGNNPQAREAINRLTDTMEAQAVRSAPRPVRQQLRDEMRDLNTRYRNMSIVEDAMASGTAEARAAGLVTPTALKSAIARRDKREYTRGRSDMARLARAGEGVIRPLPSSGTAERAFAQGMISGPGAAIGGFGGMAMGDPTLAVIGALGPPAARAITARTIMSRPVQNYFGNQAVPQTIPPIDPLTARLLAPYLLTREGEETTPAPANAMMR